MGWAGSCERRPGVWFSEMPVTVTPGVVLPGMGCAWKVSWRALYDWPSGPATESALARLLATTLSRLLWADTALPEMANTSNRDMVVSFQGRGLLAGDGGQHGPHMAVDETQRGFVTHRVVGKVGTFAVEVHGVAVDTGLFCGAENHRRLAVGAASQRQVRVVGGGLHHLGLLQGTGEVHVLRLVARGVGIGNISGQNLLTLRQKLKYPALSVEKRCQGLRHGGNTPMYSALI
eukprot:Opistho-1_new@103070